MVEGAVWAVVVEAVWAEVVVEAGAAAAAAEVETFLRCHREIERPLVAGGLAAGGRSQIAAGVEDAVFPGEGVPLRKDLSAARARRMSLRLPRPASMTCRRVPRQPRSSPV